MTPRYRTDAVGVALLRACDALGARAPRLLRSLLGGMGAVGATLAWPFDRELRGRIAATNLTVRPWLRGWCLGVGLADMITPVWEPANRGVELMVGRAGIMLTGHLGSWEAGGNELRRRGIDLLVLSSPWPRLPRLQAEFARLRLARGIPTVTRGRDAWGTVREHLAAGGVVAGLIDSISPRRPGRRPQPFVGSPVGAPDSLVEFARAEGVELWVAVGDAHGFEVTAVPPGSDEERADHAVARLADAVRRAPSAWAWVRPLSGLVLAVGLVTGCRAPLVPPLPTDADAWVVDVEAIRWAGTLDGADVLFEAKTAAVRWRDGAPDGRFDGVAVSWTRDDPDWPQARVDAESAVGRWPDGPLVLHEVSWQAVGHAAGTTDRLDWIDGRWTCGGCALEELAARRAEATP